MLGAGVTIALIPPPTEITTQSWRLLAIFVATIIGLIAQPLPGGAMVLLGVAATALLAPPLNAGLRRRQDLYRSHRNEIPGISCCLVA